MITEIEYKEALKIVQHYEFNAKTYANKIAEKIGADMKFVKQKCRKRKIVDQRKLIVRMIRINYADLSLEKTGEIVGVDHSTITYYNKNWSATKNFPEIQKIIHKLIQ